MDRKDLFAQIKAKKSMLCVGLDVDFEKIPACVRSSGKAKSIFEFNRAIVDATASYAVAYKPNLAFYECYGLEGMNALEATVDYIRTNYPDIFKVAVAGGPVIDWKWYEVMYGERYMGNPETNSEGYALTSLIPKAKDLKGKLLICQGAVDNVVVWQHSLSFVNECIRNNVQVDYFPYPSAQHNVAGKDRIHLMDKVTMYFEDYLK